MLHPPPPLALRYIRMRAADLSEWKGYATSLLGLQVVDSTDKRLAFRMDDRKQRVIVDHDAHAKGVGYYGWEMQDAAHLDRLCAHLDINAIRFARGSRALAAERLVTDLITLSDPVGNRIEFFHGAAVTPEPLVPSRNISGFRCGPLGVGHVVMMVDSVAEAIPFYRDILGFGVSDYYDKPFTACFFHVNPRHHSFALIETGEKKVHHMMMELYSFDDVGQGYDLAQLDEARISVTLGRHAGDYMTSFYTWNPSGFMCEYGWGGQSIDPATWVAFERKEGPSLWGHNRMWLPEDDRKRAHEHTLRNGTNGVRRPVQVIEGNYTLMPGTCPWWDREVAKRA